MLPCAGFSQTSFQGTVIDAPTGLPLQGAGIRLMHAALSTLTDSRGHFSIKTDLTAMDTLQISFIGYAGRKIPAGKELRSGITLELQPVSLLSNEVFVRATRSRPDDGTVYSTVTRQQIAGENLGKDLPYLLSSLPSVVVTSDGGTGIGYTGIRIRGSDPARINVTINGIPFNDAESQQTYFVDIPDMASSVENIQVQRGVGTSSNGAGAFGGSLNIQTSSLSLTPYAESDNSFGTYNSFKNTLKFGTGALGKWNFDGRISRISSDGYTERASSLLKSLFFSGGYTGKTDVLRFNIFSGTENTYQAYNGVPQDTLPHHRRYNSFTYPNQTDNYNQDNYQLLYSKQLGSNWLLNGALHLTHGKGYYEEFESSQALAAYGLKPLMVAGTSVDTSNLVRRQWLDNYFYGVTWAAENHSAKGLISTLGGAWNQYRGLHFGEVISTQNGSASTLPQRYYDNNGVKNDFNIYEKESFTTGNLNLNLDLQYRRVHYQFKGLDEFKTRIEQQAALNFFNPKLGANLKLGEGNSVYASFGVANKEPNRDDYIQSTPVNRPKSENLQDLEAGFKHTTGAFTGGINLFYMDYYNQLVLTGKLNDVGNPIRSNVPHSYRSGIELEGNYRINDRILWKANLALSRNRIREYHEVLYDENMNAISNVYHHTEIAFSPDIVGSSIFDFLVFKNFHTSLISKYVGRQYLDNTSHENRKIKPYFLNDIRFNYKIKTGWIPELDMILALNNIMNIKYVTNGSAYPYIQSGQTINSNYYYPQAPYNMSFGLNMRF